jgi:acetoin utilization deacetylase AcuC-like enzyme
MTLFITHSACLEHLTPPGHPERPERLRAIERVIEQEKFMFLLREQCPKAELEVIGSPLPAAVVRRGTARLSGQRSIALTAKKEWPR